MAIIPIDTPTTAITTVIAAHIISIKSSLSIFFMAPLVFTAFN